MAVLSMLGASSNDSINQLYPLAAICFVIILISGVFMISSCMNSTVAQSRHIFTRLFYRGGFDFSEPPFLFVYPKPTTTQTP